MGTTEQGPGGESGFDLLDRWLAHHEGQSVDTAVTVHDDAVAPLAEPAVEPVADPPVAETPVAETPVAESADVESADVEAPAPHLGGQVAAGRAILELLGASAPASTPSPGAPAEDQPEPDAARAVVAAFAATRGTGPVTPPIPERAGVAERGAAVVSPSRTSRESMAADPLPEVTDSPTERPATTAAPPATLTVTAPADPAVPRPRTKRPRPPRSLLATAPAPAGPPASDPAPAAITEAVRAVTATPLSVRPDVTPPAAEAAAELAAEPLTTGGVPDVVEFTPRRGTRRITGLLLVVLLAATGWAAYGASQAPTTTALGVAGTLGVLTLVVWAVRAGSAVATLTVRGGQLEIMRGGSRHRFDLASRYTPIDIVGEPGSRGWKVLFHRRSMAPYVVDSSMVDPVEFTRVVRHYRPAD